MCRVPERGADNFQMCGNCQCLYYCSKSCQLKEWKQHETVCDGINQLKVDRKRKCVQNKHLQYNSSSFLHQNKIKLSSELVKSVR